MFSLAVDAEIKEMLGAPSPSVHDALVIVAQVVQLNTILASRVAVLEQREREHAARAKIAEQRLDAIMEYIEKAVAVTDPERACGDSRLPEPEVCDGRGCGVYEREDCDELISQARAYERLRAAFEL